MLHPKFGTAGAGDLFYAKGHKHSQEVPAFLSDMGLTAFEYQCGHGVRIGEEKAWLLGEEAKKYGITLSIHAPYFISLSAEGEASFEKNLRYFLSSVKAAKDMGAKRVIFHPGGASKMSREKAFSLIRDALDRILTVLSAEGYDDICLCPETMGKINQIGDLEETIALCQLRDNLLPCVDFGHLNARTGGQVNNKEAYAAIFAAVEKGLGAEKARNIHCHFSKIEYGNSGEKKHLTFEDTAFGPDYEPLMTLLYEKGYTPTIICESAGTQTEDALTMSHAYFAGAKGKEE